mgnify:CR=1 FL=1
MLPEEPARAPRDPTAPTTMIRFTLPSGTRVQRNFFASDTLEVRYVVLWARAGVNPCTAVVCGCSCLVTVGAVVGVSSLRARSLMFLLVAQPPICLPLLSLCAACEVVCIGGARRHERVARRCGHEQF